jgi:hypothetical protein
MRTTPAKLLLGIALAMAAACADKAKESALPDSSLARDLALASAQPSQPTFQDTAIAPAPVKAAAAPKREAPAPVKARSAPPPKPQPRQVAQAPAPQPQPAVIVPQAIAPAPLPAPPRGENGAGSAGVLTSGNKVCTSSNLVGDKIVATLNAPLTGTHGAEIPAGSTVVLELATLQSGDKAENAQLTFRVRSIVVNDKTYSVNAEVAPSTGLDRQKVQAVDPNADKKKVAGGAVAGAILGQILGRSTKSTIIGAAAGAAAGAAVAKSQEKWEACLPAGAQLNLKITEALVLM